MVAVVVYELLDDHESEVSIAFDVKSLCLIKTVFNLPLISYGEDCHQLNRTPICAPLLVKVLHVVTLTLKIGL